MIESTLNDLVCLMRHLVVPLIDLLREVGFVHKR